MSAKSKRTKATPLPRLQIFIAYLLQFLEVLTAQVIYPFINQLVRDTGINKGDETKTGYYAGLFESVFFLTECLSVVQWGYLSDKVGRRPVLLLGPLGLSISMLLFGLSKTLRPLLIFRCLQGLFNGNIAVTRTVIAELSDETNIGDAYALAPIMRSSAFSIAPIIGGALSQPGERWPEVFGRLPFFKLYPYFLPCATVSFIAFLSFAVTFLALKETLPSVVAKKIQAKQHTADAEARLIDYSDSVDYGAIASNVEAETSQVDCPSTLGKNLKSSSFHTVSHRPLLLVLLNYSFLVSLAVSNGVLMPLMYSTPIEFGGLGMSPFAIGTALGTFGIVNAVFLARFLGPLMRYFGTRKLFRIGMLSPCIMFLMYPVMKYAAQKAGSSDRFVIGCITIHLALRCPLLMAYGAIQVLIVQSIPEGGSLATANGFGQMLASGMRTIAPIIASSLFSISLQRSFANGDLVYYFFVAMSLLGIRVSWLLREPTCEEKTDNMS